MNRSRRIQVRLPEPVEVESTVWQARAWQTVVGALDHLDECMDELKGNITEYKAETTARIETLAATKLADHQHFQAALEAHEAMHKEIDARKDAKSGVWRFQGDMVYKVLTLLTQGAAFGLIVSALKVIGVI